MHNGRNGRTCLMRVHKTAKNMSSDSGMHTFLGCQRDKKTLWKEICQKPYSPSQPNLSSFSCGCFSASFPDLSSLSCGCLSASFNSSSSLISLCAAVTSVSKNFKIATVIIPPIAANTALRKISLLGNISARFVSEPQTFLTDVETRRVRAIKYSLPSPRKQISFPYVPHFRSQSKPLKKLVHPGSSSLAILSIRAFNDRIKLRENIKRAVNYSLASRAVDLVPCLTRGKKRVTPFMHILYILP